MASRGVNKVILVGNLGADPELRYTGNGTAVANMRLATNESYKDSDGNLVEKTEWHNLVAWSRLAEICGEFLKKGRQVYVEGTLQTRQWEDKEGQTRYTTEIKVRELQMLGGNGGADEAEGGTESKPKAAGRGGHERPAKPTKAQAAAGAEDLSFTPDDDLPF